MPGFSKCEALLFVQNTWIQSGCRYIISDGDENACYPYASLQARGPWNCPFCHYIRRILAFTTQNLLSMYLNETRNSLLCVCSFVVFVDLWIFISLQKKLNQQVRFNNFKNSDISFSYKGRDVIFCVSVTNLRKIKWMKRYHYMSRYGKYNMQLLLLQLQT